MNINDKWSHYALVKKACLVLKFGGIGLPAAQPAYTEKCRFMDKRVREISRFLLRCDASSPPPSGASHGFFYPEIPPAQ